MFCPRCGHQPITDTIRFCSYCGFKLGVVRASLSDDDEVRAIEPPTKQTPPAGPRQKDVNIGVMLMFLGALFTLLIGRSFGREGGAIILLAFFSAIVLFSRPLMKVIYNLLSSEELPAQSFSVNQRRMVFGAILMFVSTILSALSSLYVLGRMATEIFLFCLACAFVFLLLTSKYLIKALRFFVADDTGAAVLSRDAAPAPVSIGDAVSSPTLTAGHDVPVSLFTSPRVITAEILAPASVTEHTTNLLDNK